MISSFRRDGTREYRCKTLEGNWQEDRSRLEVGETVELELMKGAYLRPADPDISIAPPTRVALDPWGNPLKSDGVLQMCLRSYRGRTMLDSSRLNADDGYREYQSLNQTFYIPPEDRNTCPCGTEPYFHGTWGGPVQFDGRTKTRTGPYNRSKNATYEQGPLADGEHTVAKKLLTIDTFAHALASRPVPGPQTGSGFGTVLPRHPEDHGARILTSTAMASWKKPVA
jgi:hypothetical protein